MGYTISIEGIDGAGKTTLVAGLAKWLDSLGHTVKCLKEPGSTELGEYLREVLLGGSKMGIEVVPRARLFLYLASMINTQELEIKKGGYDYYLLDRWSLSSRAYQFPLVSEGDIERVINAAGILTPTFTILIDVSPSVGIARTIPDDATAFISHSFEAALSVVRQNYLNLAERYSWCTRVVDGSGSAEDTLLEAKTILGEALALSP